MKFIEIKKELENNLKSAYLIFGEDAFLCDSAEKMIEKRCVKNFPELNISKFNDENFNIEKVLETFKSFPFGGDKRVVVISGVNLDQTAQKEIKKYLEVSQQDFCLILKNITNFQSIKSIFMAEQMVDCSGIDEQTLKSVISQRLRKYGISIDNYAQNMIIDYCNGDMTFIDQEIKKLCSYCNSGEVVTKKIVEEMVHKNLDFAIFELSNFLIDKDSKKVFESMQFLLESKETPQKLLGLLLGVFRRMFFAQITNDTTANIAKMLNVKEYSIKIAKQQKDFSPKKLKHILDFGGELDFNIKKGKISDETALNVFVAEILKM